MLPIWKMGERSSEDRNRSPWYIWWCISELNKDEQLFVSLTHEQLGAQIWWVFKSSKLSISWFCRRFKKAIKSYGVGARSGQRFYWSASHFRHRRRIQLTPGHQSKFHLAVPRFSVYIQKLFCKSFPYQSYWSETSQLYRSEPTIMYVPLESGSIAFLPMYKLA